MGAAETFYHRIIKHRTMKDVALHVTAVFTKIDRQFAIDHQYIPGNGADAVTRSCVGEPVAKTAPVVGGHMRYAITGPADLGIVAQVICNAG